MISTQVGLASPYVAHVKGAPNYVLESCAKTLHPDGSVGALDAATRDTLRKAMGLLAAKAEADDAAFFWGDD